MLYVLENSERLYIEINDVMVDIAQYQTIMLDDEVVELDEFDEM